MPGKEMTERERLALRDKARDPEHRCMQCGHRRAEHSYDREDDFMCLTCPEDACFYDPYTRDEWRRIWGF